MNRSKNFGRKCIVPNCKNSSSNSPNKVFVHVSENLKKSWCEIVQRSYVPNQRLYCCEDHLILEEDLENYDYWRITRSRPTLKTTAKLRLGLSTEIGILGHTENRAPESISSSLKRLLTTERECPDTKKQCVKSTCVVTTESSIKVQEESHSSTLQSLLLQERTEKCTSNKPTAVSAYTHKIQIDVATQCKPDTQDKGTYMRKPLQFLHQPPPIQDEPTDSTTPVSHPSSPMFQISCMSSSDSKINYLEHHKQCDIYELVYKYPKTYLGLPEKFIWVIEHILNNSSQSVQERDLIIALMKIKLNDTMFRLSHIFNLSRNTVKKSLVNGLEVLTNFFQNFIFMPSKIQIKRTLPLAFQMRFSNVQCIIDAFEIEIEKPTDPLHQAQTWSQYKHCNTIKYLIGCTPAGFVSYLSKGFGGRISDKALVENSDLIEKLPFNSVIMADRGFKEIETFLISKGIKLLRPPSVFSSIKPTKDEVIQTKVIASLRVHIERVIRRVREFRFLKPHSVVNNKHISYLDEIVTIACGLINLQDELIKSK